MSNLKKYVSVFFLLLIPLCLTGCHEVEEVPTTKVESEVTEGDFAFRLISEKNSYKKDEEIVIYGELEYIGEASAKQITHGKSVMMFDVEEKTKGVVMYGGIRASYGFTILSENKPYQEFYQSPKKLASGIYTVTGYAVFSDIKMETAIDFIVK